MGLFCRSQHGSVADAVIRVLICDDQELVRSGLVALVEGQEDMAVVGQAQNGSEAIEVSLRVQPDVVVMDVRMPVLDGIAAAAQITSHPDLGTARVLMLTTFDLDQYVYGALEAGASGFLLKDTSPALLLAGIRTIASGDALLAPSVTRRLIADFVPRPNPDVATELDVLTDRERDVLVEVGNGLSNDEIAAKLFISPLTAKTHVSRLRTKLAVHDRAQLVVIAFRTGLVSVVE